MTWKKFVVIAIPAIALALGASGVARAGNLVQNGSFEMTGNGPGQINWQTEATDWNAGIVGSGHAAYCFIYDSAANPSYSPEFGQEIYLWGPATSTNNGMPDNSPDGGNFLAADGAYGNNPISQTISGLTIGDTYTLGFWFAYAQQAGFYGATTDYWTVSLGDQTQYTPTMTIPTAGFSGWMYQTMTFTADNTSDVLSFFATGAPGGPPFLLLDGVSLTASVPEPSTLSLMAFGLLGLGAVSLRRRARKSAAV